MTTADRAAMETLNSQRQPISSPTVSIRHPSLRPRNMVATVGIVFMRHEGEIRSIETDRLLRHPAHPCNTLSHAIKRSWWRKSRVLEVTSRTDAKSSDAIR